MSQSTIRTTTLPALALGALLLLALASASCSGGGGGGPVDPGPPTTTVVEVWVVDGVGLAGLSIDLFYAADFTLSVCDGRHSVAAERRQHIALGVSPRKLRRME